MSDPEGIILKDLIIGVVGFRVGLSIYLGWINVLAWRRGDAAALYYALARWGTAVMLLLLVEALFRAPSVPLEWRSFLFLVGGVASCVGLGGVIYYHRQRRRGRI